MGELIKNCMVNQIEYWIMDIEYWTMNNEQNILNIE